jgi:hypothetical protein
MASKIDDDELPLLPLGEATSSLPLAYRKIYVKKLAPSMQIEREGLTNEHYRSVSYAPVPPEIPLSKFTDA